MGKLNNMQKQYPLIARYIKTNYEQSEILRNRTFKQKYKAYEETIKTYIYELERHYSYKRIELLIRQTVIDMPTPILVSFMSAYLNSTEEIKADESIIEYFSKILFMESDCLKYIEENGFVPAPTIAKLNKLIAEKNDEIKEIEIDRIFYTSVSEDESFKGELLKNCYESANIQEKQIIMKLISNNVFSMLDEIFKDMSFNLKSFLDVLIQKNIKIEIFNKEFIETISPYYFMILFCMIVDNEYSSELMDKIITLTQNKQYTLIRKHITDNNLTDLRFVKVETDLINNPKLMYC